MALDFQLVQAPFRFGIEEGVDPKQVPFGTLVRAENVVWKKTGRLEKRQGVEALTTAISGGGLINSAKRLILRGDELNLTDGTNLYTYADDAWISRGRVPEMGLEWSTIQDGVQGAQSADIGYLDNGHVIYAWVTGDPLDTTLGSGELYYAVVDLESGSFITPPTIVQSSVGCRFRIVVSGSTWVLVYANGASLRSFINGTQTTLKTDVRSALSVEQSLDACLIGTEFVVAYAINTGGIRLVRYSMATVPVQQATSTVTGLASTSIYCISIAGAAGETLYIGYADKAANLIRFAAANPSTLVQTVAPATVEPLATLGRARIGLVRTSSTTCSFVYSFEDYGAIKNGMLWSKQVTSAGVISTGQASMFMALLSRPFILGGRTYALVTSDPDAAIADNLYGADTFILDVTWTSTTVTPSREVAKIDLDVGGRWAWGHVSEVPVVSSTRAILPAPFQSDSASAIAGWRQGIRLVSATIGASVPADMWRTVVIGQEGYLAAGLVSSYDGVEVFGYGFAHPPFPDAQSTTSSGVGGSMAAGTYLYNVTAERRTAAGVLHRGPVGVTNSKTVAGATSKVTLGVVQVSISISNNSVSILPIYRSTADGEVLHRLTIEPNYVTLYNVATSTPLNIIDTSADTSIAGTGIQLDSREVLYTEGGELEDQQPPGMITCALYRERIFAIAGDRQSLWFTKCHASNPGIAPGFSTSFRIVFNDTLTALAVLDERLLVFSETGIYHMAGDGPAPNGDGSDYNQANKLQTDAGCSNPRSVVSGPDGVFFESNGDIQMLDRGLNVVWIGKPVQDQLAAYPNITSAVIVSKKNQVRFTCNNASNTACIVLVYDYVERQWSTFIYGGVSAIADACIHDGVYTFVTLQGVVYKESEETHLDAGAWVTARIVTAWVHAAGPLAYHSVRNFRIDGVSISDHGLAISAGFNGDETPDQQKIWAPSTADVTAPGDSVTANLSIGTQRKCRSIRFEISDVEPPSPGVGAGPQWSSMGIEVGLKRGLGVLPVRQKG